MKDLPALSNPNTPSMASSVVQTRGEKKRQTGDGAKYYIETGLITSFQADKKFIASTLSEISSTKFSIISRTRIKILQL